MLTALSTVSSFYGENTINSRRNLRGDIEQRSLVLSQQFLTEMEMMNDALEMVGNDLDNMAKSCDEMNARFVSARSTTQHLIDHTSKIKRDCETLQAQEKVVNNFISHFQLSEEEIHHLKKEEMDADFFRVLERVQKIYTDCKPLLRTAHQQAGIEIMDTMSMLQETAYERLYRWVQQECKNLDRESPDITQLLQRGVKTLRHRTAFFKHCMQGVMDVRRTAVLKAFLQALTRGNRSIESHSQDPVRFVSDMLAWLHQSAASEHEIAILLLSNVNITPHLTSTTVEDVNNTNTNTNNNNNNNNKEGADDEQIYEILDNIFEGVVRSFSVRMESILSTPHINSAIIYRLSSLLGFYLSTIGSIIGTKAALCVELANQHQSCLNYFFTSLKGISEHVLRFPPSCPSSLSAPSLVHEIMQQLIEVMKIYDGGLTPQKERKADFAPVLQALIEPLLRSIALSATGLDEADMATYIFYFFIFFLFVIIIIIIIIMVMGCKVSY
jgi:hypothetical protein